MNLDRQISIFVYPANNTCASPSIDGDIQTVMKESNLEKSKSKLWVFSFVRSRVETALIIVALGLVVLIVVLTSWDLAYGEEPINVDLKALPSTNSTHLFQLNFTNATGYNIPVVYTVTIAKGTMPISEESNMLFCSGVSTMNPHGIPDGNYTLIVNFYKINNQPTTQKLYKEFYIKSANNTSTVPEFGALESVILIVSVILVISITAHRVKV